MDISSISSLSNSIPVYNSQSIQSSSSINSTDTSANDTKSSDNSASIMQAIEVATTGNNSALKLIGGNGSANMLALVNVAKSAVSENVNASIIGSIGKSGSENDIYGIIQNQYANSGNLGLYQRIQALQSDKASAPSQSDILDTLTHPSTQQSNSQS